jgi:hypothetical protein
LDLEGLGQNIEVASIANLRRNLNKGALDELNRTGSRLLVMRYEEPIGVIIPMRDFLRLSALEDADHVRQLLEAETTNT